ncbi:putative esterase [Afipia carboxidovorans OM5]|uniref:Putative hydrolase n=1 Tax=Afipia carboxidovorans (strain ATCC 49405 / DSM 1227 / KCTC 32145 / OM5) TaxID=504832 RepID=B6JB32_AFIC5|nr:alpha/beta hydrolase [Afipia carboxidovorans]ACI92106.1 putative esterase [Afipia carboxidovorans OM5]AEI04046.1 putative hydrolase [Afipia carboxidovorans OM4]AEI07676.1 putative hydrolase [Afipia carboxidovorans OM5]
MSVYRGFTQDELDSQYNVRNGIPDYLDIFERWARESAEFRAQARHYFELTYGSNPAQKIDLFLSGRDNAPLVVFIHGGYWHSLDKSDFSYIARPYIDAGLNFATINYRLAPSVKMEAIVSDVRNALLFLHNTGGCYGYAWKHIYVTGSSAGGHLTATALSTDWVRYGVPPDLVRGGCALSGLYDLEPILLSYLNDKVQLDRQDVRDFSPIQNLPRKASPLLLAVGGDESDEFQRQQANYFAAWQSAGLSVEVIEQTNGHHFDMCDRLGDRDNVIFKAVMAMVNEDKAKSSGTDFSEQPAE